MQLQKSINRWLPDEKMMVLEKESDALLVLRKVGSQKLRNIIQRDRRPHLLAEQVEFVPENEVWLHSNFHLYRLWKIKFVSKNTTKRQPLSPFLYKWGFDLNWNCVDCSIFSEKGLNKSIKMCSFMTIHQSVLFNLIKKLLKTF